MDPIDMTVAALAVTLSFILLGHLSKRRTHAPSPMVNPLLPMMIIGYVAAYVLSEAMRGDYAMVVYTFSLVGFVLGHEMGRDETRTTLWELYSEEEGGEYVHTEVTYVHRGRKYVMRNSIVAVLMSFLGLRDPLIIESPSLPEGSDATMVSNTRQITFKRRFRKIRMSGMVLAVSRVRKVSVGRIRIGHRDGLNEDGENVKVPRYLWNPKVTQFYGMPCDRSYQMPSVFWTDFDLWKKSREDAVQLRGQVSRLTLAFRGAKDEGQVEHVMSMMSLDVDNPNLDRDIRALLKAEAARRGVVVGTATETKGASDES